MTAALDLTYRQDETTPDLCDLLHARLDDFGPLAIDDAPDGAGWRVFFQTQSSRDAAGEALEAEFGHRLLAVLRVDVPDPGWARKSQANLTAVRVGRVVVAPPWAIPADDPAVVTVVIEPSMGFGTGHHATTRLSLELLQQQGLAGRRVIDVGTGSGVLAIAAWKLGATSCTAVDCDPDALQNAGENALVNGAADAVTLLECDLGRLDLEPAAVVLANLTSAVLQKHADRLRRLVAPGGVLIVSGFGPDELTEVERAFGCPASTVVTEGAWAAARVPFIPPTGI